MCRNTKYHEVNKILVGAVLSLTFGSANAVPNVFTGPVTIKTISNWGGAGNESLYIKTDEPIVNPASCSSPGEYFLDSNQSDLSKAMIMAAKINNSQVTFVIWGNGCASNNRPTIVNVGLPE